MNTKLNFPKVLNLLAMSMALSAAPAWSSCVYSVTNNWGSGFTAEIKVTNDTSQTLNNWSVSWQESGATITNSWNATLSGSNPYSAASLNWNGTLAPKASASFGFQANGTAGSPKVNGTLCGTTTSSTPSSTAISSVASSIKSSTPSSISSSSVSGISSFTIQEAQAGFCRVDGVATESSNAGYTGNGYTNPDNAQNSAIEWAVNAPTSSRYTLTFRFANASGTNRNGSLLINGGSNGNYTVQLPSTGAWTNWETASIEIDLVQGNNILKLSSLTADGLANIDSLKIEGAQTKAGTCSVVSSSSASSVKSSSSSSSSVNNNSCPKNLEGWASVNADGVNGTTGGGNATPTIVKTFAELKAAVQDRAARVVIISGTIKTEGGSALAIASNKTVQGADKNATIYGGISMNGVSNIIIRNLNIQGTWPNSGPDDTISSRNSHHIWYDHLNIWDSTDGSLDITNESNYQTVSWTKFWYSNKSHGHRFASLNGSGAGDHPEDWGKLKTTYHHNWWSTNVDQRMPRVVYGIGHQYNNFFNSTGNSYCIGVGSYGAVLIENNYFKNVNNPHQFMYDVYMHITARGNIYDNTTGAKNTGMGGARKVSGQDFNVVPFTTAPYKYNLDSADKVPDLVTRCAGPQ